MQTPELQVRNIIGRYPRGDLMRSDNVEVQVFEVARIYRIRIDDAEHPEMWMEITVEVDTSDIVAESSTSTAA